MIICVFVCCFQEKTRPRILFFFWFRMNSPFHLVSVANEKGFPIYSSRMHFVLNGWQHFAILGSCGAAWFIPCWKISSGLNFKLYFELLLQF